MAIERKDDEPVPHDFDYAGELIEELRREGNRILLIGRRWVTYEKANVGGLTGTLRSRVTWTGNDLAAMFEQLLRDETQPRDGRKTDG